MSGEINQIPKGEIRKVLLALTGKNSESGLSYKVSRLTRTEINHAVNSATNSAYRRMNVKRYKYIATLDHSTCSECWKKNGKIYPVTKLIQGVNAPPLHPNCRCYLEPVLNKKQKDDAKKKAKKEQKQFVPMTYEQWYAKYVK